MEGGDGEDASLYDSKANRDQWEKEGEKWGKVHTPRN